VINFGIGGAYPGSGLDVNHIAVATTEVYADEGVWLTDGYHGLDVIGIPLARAGQRRYFNEFPMDGRLARSALRASVLVAPSRSGAFATVSLCTGTKRRALDMVKRFNVVCENMEGASIAHVCRLYNTPCVEIRGISNRVDDRNRADWDIGTSSANCQRAVIEFLQSLRRLP
jgi:futalosine hydrolase